MVLKSSLVKQLSQQGLLHPVLHSFLNRQLNDPAMNSFNTYGYDVNTVHLDNVCVNFFQQMPETEAQRLANAEDFETKWLIPHCLGVTDNKHMVIKKPTNSGSACYNNKHTVSTVLLPAANANYRFIYVDTDCQARISDGECSEILRCLPRYRTTTYIYHYVKKCLKLMLYFNLSLLQTTHFRL
jgi:hypothetical protein